MNSLHEAHRITNIKFLFQLGERSSRKSALTGPLKPRPPGAVSDRDVTKGALGISVSLHALIMLALLGH